MEGTEIFVHYGSGHFEPSLFKPIKNRRGLFYSKPYGGLWGSTDAEDGWKSWCESDGMGSDKLSLSFRFRIRAGSKVLRVRTKEDLAQFVVKDGGSYIADLRERRCPALDFEAMSMKYDAVIAIKSELSPNVFDGFSMGAAKEKDRHPGLLHGWDCDSVLILRPGCVAEIRPEKEAEADGKQK